MATIAPTWRDRAADEIERLAATGRPFTSDDVIDAVGHPDDRRKPNGRNNLIGAAFYSASVAGLIHQTGFTVSRYRRGGVTRVWVGR